jgi:hypothetical protein
MRKLVLASAALVCCTSVYAAYVTGHTFFSARPHFQTASPEYVSFFRNDLLNTLNSYGGAGQIVIFGSQTTTDSARKTARFFLPNGCATNCLTVKEYIPGKTQDSDPFKDLDATHFNIRTVLGTFSSTVCFVPRQKIFGIGLSYKQRLSWTDTHTVGFWAELSAPIERVENSIQIIEYVHNDGGGPIRTELGLDDRPPVANLKQAFAQPNWRYGKIANCACPRAKWGVADIELKLGYTTLTYPSILCPLCSLNSFVGVIFPSGTRVKSKYMFEPIVGNNHHVGIFSGTSASLEFHTSEQWRVLALIDMASRYYFPNKQIRSFDLVGKSFSRYCEVYSRPEYAAYAAQDKLVGAGTSGINIFTQCVRVSPHFSGDVTIAMLINRICALAEFMLELGFNLYARQAETVELLKRDAILNSVGLKAVQGKGGTNHARTIKDNYPQSTASFDQSYLSLNNCVIDLACAAHPAVISHTLYGAVGYRWNTSCPGFVGLGGSYEFTPDKINSALERWTLWGKLGITF